MKQPSSSRHRRTFMVSLLVTGTLLAPSQARAEPPSSRITAVFDTARCEGDPCEPGRDPQVKEGVSIDGAIQIHVRSEATYGLEWVRLEAHLDGEPQWFCLELWRPDLGTFEMSGSFTWSTARWPDPPTQSRCEDGGSLHYHGGKPTTNGSYRLRVVARDRSAERAIETDSPAFPIVLVNGADPPRWAKAPTVEEDANGAPNVELRWLPNEETKAYPPWEGASDIVEYHFVRVGPDGSDAEFAVNAANPSAQGCRRVSALYQCEDDSFAHGYGGAYRYALLAYRPGYGEGVPCATTEGTCIESRLSETRAVTLTDDPRAVPVSEARRGRASSSPTPTSTSVPSPQAGADEPIAVAPSEDRSQQLTAVPGATPDKTIPVSVALALLFGLSYAQSRRFWSEVS